MFLWKRFTAPLQGFNRTAFTAAQPSAAPAGGVGTAAGGWDTAGNRDLAIATINGLRTRLLELEAKLTAAGILK